MRGKEGRLRHVVLDQGITPAYAGKSLQRGRAHPDLWDHPRICGEKAKRHCPLGELVGSPPHMRGKVNVHGAQRLKLGITPAYAGKSGRKADHHPRWRDHPRICGEKWGAISSVASSAGSPPHMRGKVSMKTPLRIFLGITPAYAGKSHPPEFPGSAQWDHPRICGEKPSAACQLCKLTGSPPHMRGKVTISSIRRMETGITPAYAGKSGHARQLALRAEGSPPHMRGKAFSTPKKNMVSRITPAYAGKSRLVRIEPERRGDHPRICGEKQELRRAPQ